MKLGTQDGRTHGVFIATAISPTESEVGNVASKDLSLHYRSGPSVGEHPVPWLCNLSERHQCRCQWWVPHNLNQSSVQMVIWTTTGNATTII